MTMPLSSWYVALVGQLRRQMGFSHWLHMEGTKETLTKGYFPFSICLTQVRNTPSGTSISALHATEHAWHPVHRRRSTTIPYLTPVAIAIPALEELNCAYLLNSP